MGIIGGGVYVLVLLVLLHQKAKTAAITALVLSTVTLSEAAWQYRRKSSSAGIILSCLQLWISPELYSAAFFSK